MDSRRAAARWLAALTTAVLVLGAAAAAAAQASGMADLVFTPGPTLALPGDGKVVGLTAAGADTLAVLLEEIGDAGRRRIRLLVQAPDGRILHDEDFSGVLDRGLGWDGESLWSCGDAADGSSILYAIRPDSLGVLVTTKAYTAPGHRPTALAWDGTHLWLTDRDSGRIDRFDPEIEEFTRFVASPGFSPCGLAWDGAAMWLTDAGTGRLYRLVGGRLQVNGVVDTLSFLHRGDEILLFHDGRNLWYLPAGQRVAVQVDFR